VTAVIFDCDGTLVDSEPLARRAWEITLGERGYTVAAADFAAVVGRSFDTVHAYFAERVELPARERFWDEFSAELFALLDSELRAFADAIATLDELIAAGVPVAVASSSSRERLARTLRLTSLTERFPVSVAGDEVERGKPHPDLFLAAAAGLGAEPASCVVVEDTAPGVEAGLAAGAAVLAVARDSGARSALAGAHVVANLLSAARVREAAAAARRARARAPAR
jgi:HAD superfamily hydrolase (TIGR01509 family)